MKCINCSQELDTTRNLVYYCKCGAQYSFEIIQEAESNINIKIEWEHIRLNKLFRFENGLIMVSKIGNEHVHPDVMDLHNKYLANKGR